MLQRILWSYIFINRPIRAVYSDWPHIARSYTSLDNRTDAKGTWKVSGSRRGDRYLAGIASSPRVGSGCQAAAAETAIQVEREIVPRFLVAQPPRLRSCMVITAPGNTRATSYPHPHIVTYYATFAEITGAKSLILLREYTLCVSWKLRCKNRLFKFSSCLVNWKIIYVISWIMQLYFVIIAWSLLYNLVLSIILFQILQYFKKRESKTLIIILINHS